MAAHLRRFILLLAVLLTGLSLSPPPSAAATERRPALRVFVDTDVGVDDAVALAYLLRSREADVLGFTTVAGNTTVENATSNLLALLDVMQLQRPVTVGAAAPLTLPRSRTGALVHGPTGLWFAAPPRDTSGLPHDAPAAIAAAARANPGMTLLALGPLTNVAEALRRFPADLRGLQVVAVAGTRGPGNSSPVAEFNAYFDPHAADAVVEGGLRLTLVTADAFTQATFDAELPQVLAERGGAVGRFLAPPVSAYFQAQTQGAGGDVALPDVAGVAYLLNARLGTASSALVDVSTEAGLTRGQTVMALTLGQRVAMIAGDERLSELADQLFTTPGFDLAAALGQILMSRPDNAQVVLDMHGPLAARVAQRALTGR